MGVYEPDCDDVTEDGICLGDMVYCDENRRRCETADDFYHKTDGYRYFQRFQPLYNNMDDTCDCIDESNNGKLRVNLTSKDDAYKLANFLNQWDHKTRDLKELLEPIQEICDKYNIPLKDLPATLEEYILQDNE